MSQDPKKAKHEPPDTFQTELERDDMNVRDIHGAILREKDEPRDDYEPVPLWLVVILMLLMFWGGGYLVFFSGGFRADVFNPTKVSWSGAGGGAEKAAPDPMVMGKKLFTANCVACHQATGQGMPGAFPPLAGSEWVLGQGWHGDNHLVKVVLHGLQGQVQVKGDAFNGAMPPWKQLKDDQIAAILTFVRNEWGNSAPPITAEQVAKIREETAAQTEPYTQAQLQAIPAVHFGGAAESAPPETKTPAASGTPPGV